MLVRDGRLPRGKCLGLSRNESVEVKDWVAVRGLNLPCVPWETWHIVEQAGARGTMQLYVT